MFVSQTLAPVAVRNGSKVAFKYLKYAVSYKDFWDTVNRFSYFLQKELGHGLRVGLWMSNCPHVAYCFIALSNTKSCTVPLNPWASPDENLFKIKHGEVTAILCSSDHTRSLREFLAQNGLGTIKIIEMDTKRCAEYDTTYTPPTSHPMVESDPILLFYTPGTTGKHKGCLFDHKAVCNAINSVKGAYKTLPTDVFYTQHLYADPFNFIHFLLAPLLAGATVYISDQVDPNVILPALTEHRVTRMAPKLTQLLELLKTSVEAKMPIPTVKSFVFHCASLEKPVLDVVKKFTKAYVQQSYGVTEYLGTIAMGTPDHNADSTKPLGFCGPPLVGTKIRLMDDNNEEIDKKKKQRGQIVAMGGNVMSKYWNLPEEMKDEQKKTIRGTWLFTGDFVDIDKDGNVIFLDRMADVVVTQTGSKVFAREVESVLKALPQVEDCAYIGIRDRLKKPIPALVVVKKQQAQVTEKALEDLLKSKINVAKMPARIFFVDALPRSVSGALNRAKLRSMFDGM